MLPAGVRPAAGELKQEVVDTVAQFEARRDDGVQRAATPPKVGPGACRTGHRAQRTDSCNSQHRERPPTLIDPFIDPATIRLCSPPHPKRADRAERRLAGHEIRTRDILLGRRTTTESLVSKTVLFVGSSAYDKSHNLGFATWIGEAARRATEPREPMISAYKRPNFVL